jgi:hypothetical protein
VTTGGPSFAFTPPPGSYTTTWQAPAGWTAGTPTNNGNNISFTTDDYTAGAVTATSTYTACGYAQSMHLNVTRIYPAPTFPSSDAPRICGSALGETTTFVYSINPVAGAVNYTYTLHNNPSGVPDNISFDGTGGQTTLTTTSTSVTLACSSTQNQVLALDVIAHFPDNGTSGAEFIFDYAILWWTPTYTWYGCFNEQGTAVSAVANPDFPGAYYFWYLDGFLIDEGYANTTTWLWRGEHFLQVKATTECGETELYGETVPSQGCYNTFAPNNFNNGLTVYPNPASRLVNIQVKKPGKNTKASDAAFKDIREIRVMDKLGNVKKISRFDPGSRTITLDLSNLPNDVYILQVSDGSNRASLHVTKIN